MLKIIRYLKPFLPSVFVILVLLFIQATSDLALPDYTSNIVNVGIQQKGIENAVPQVIRQTELARLKLFMTEADQKKVAQSYRLLSKTNLSAKELKSYQKNYPLLKRQPLYKLNTNNKKVMKDLNNIIGKAILIVSGIEKKGISGFTTGKQQANPKYPTTRLPANDPGKLDPFTIIQHLPKEQMKAILAKINEGFRNLPPTMVTQAAIAYLHKEYQVIGVNTNRLQTNYIIIAGIEMLLIALLSIAASITVGFLAARVAAGQSRNLRNDLFKKVTEFSIAEFDKFSTASLITRSTNDIQQIQMLMVMLLRIVFYAPILGIGGVIKVLHTDTSMSWIIVIAVAAIIALVTILFGIVIPKFKIYQRLIDRLNLVTREFLTGILVIRAFNNQSFEEAKFEDANQALTRNSLFINRLMSTMMPMMMVIMNMITLLVVWVGAHQIDIGKMQVGNMMAFIQYAMQIIMAFLMLSMVSIILPRASVAAQRIAEVLETDITISNPKMLMNFTHIQKSSLEFKNVSFRYPGAEEDVLTEINFKVRPGQTTAFVGGTGSGKTTLVNLILRFYDVSKGEILVDGLDIRQADIRSLRAKIGYVSQKSVLFSGTIESNIRYGNHEATDSEVNKAAEIAQAIEFIQSTPKGFQTEISQGGKNVSGGQKQRLAIARALVKRPEIFIFDDSFSALDFQTDAALRKALKAVTKESSVLIIAQRISTVMKADQIIVLDEGKIAGMGLHQDLLKNCEVYRQIALSQLTKEELEA